jgi:hypothetical protein
MSWWTLRVWNIADRLLVYHIFTLLYSFVFFQISVASLWKYFTMNLSFLRQKRLFNRFLNSYINILSDQQIRPFFLSRTMLCCVVLLTSCIHIFNLIIIWNCTHVLQSYLIYKWRLWTFMCYFLFNFFICCLYLFHTCRWYNIIIIRWNITDWIFSWLFFGAYFF